MRSHPGSIDSVALLPLLALMPLLLLVSRRPSLIFKRRRLASRPLQFAPLTGLEVQGTRVQDDVLIVDVRVSVNLQSRTIEEVVRGAARSHIPLEHSTPS